MVGVKIRRFKDREPSFICLELIQVIEIKDGRHVYPKIPPILTDEGLKKSNYVKIWFKQT